jgi:hypothetical protein
VKKSITGTIKQKQKAEESSIAFKKQRLYNKKEGVNRSCQNYRLL